MTNRMKQMVKRISVLFAAVLLLGVTGSMLTAEAATKWAFSSVEGKKVSANGTLTMDKNEIQDMNIYRNGKQIKENNATYKVSWYSSDETVVAVNKKTGELCADKEKKMQSDSGKATITAVVKNKKNGGTAKIKFTVQVVTTPVPKYFTYSIENGQVTITGYTDRKAVKIEIPKRIEGYPVTKIEGDVFKFKYDLKEISIPSTVEIDRTLFTGTPIRREALEKTGMFIVNDILFAVDEAAEQITIPKGVTRIDGYAFEGCEQLKSVTIPSTVKEIGEFAFDECKQLKSVMIPSSVKEIGHSAFKDCVSLEKIELPSSVEIIGGWIFMNCKALKSAKIRGAVTEVPEGLFYGCTALEEVTMPDTVIHAGKQVFDKTPWLEKQLESGMAIAGNVIYKAKGVESAIIPKNITVVADEAFWNCFQLKEVVFPEGFKTIGARGFSNCSFKSVVLPNSVTSVGEAAFEKCMKLEEIVLSENMTSIEPDTFKKCRALKSIKLPKSIVSIGTYAFYEAIKLEEVILASKTKTIGDFAFGKCSMLTKVDLGKSLVEIGQAAFHDCSKLETITLPKTLKTIKPGAFQNCRELTRPEVPDGVTVGYDAFKNCKN